MKNSIAFKVFVVLFAANSLVVAGMYLFMRYSFEQGLVEFVETRRQQGIDAALLGLVDEYQAEGNWERLRDNRRRWIGILLRSQVEARRAGDGGQGRVDKDWQDAPHAPDAREPHGRPPRGLVLFDRDKRRVVGRAHPDGGRTLHPVVVSGDTVGFLGVPAGPPVKEIAEARFQESHARALLLVALVMLLFSAGLSVPLARRLVRPMQRIAEVSRRLGQGDYQARAPVTSGDELGQLAQDINDLAVALDAAEQSRRQWIADVSHELRTPVAILRGELETLQDGLRPFSPDAVQSLHGEAMRLTTLVDELYQLALSDVGALSYRKVSVDVPGLLRETLDQLAGEFDRRQIGLAFDMRASGRERVRADVDRLTRVFRNLLWNSLRYTDAGGRLEIGITTEQGELIIDFQDSAPGVPDDKLAQLFERFFRLEPSRSRDSGGAGLGLAICQRIVAAHDGSIEARPSPLGGLWLRIVLPIEGAE